MDIYCKIFVKIENAYIVLSYTMPKWDQQLFIIFFMLHSGLGFHCPQVHWGNTSHLHQA